MSCARKGHCRTLPMREGLYRPVNEYPDGITPADLLQNGGSGDD